MKNKDYLIIYEILDELIENPVTELKFSNEFELLVSVILSAQCTDKRVNMVTKELFQILKTPKDFAEVNLEKLEEYIHPCGFYKNKAKNIQAMSRAIIEKYNGQVPKTFEQLTSLPGVGRKTANVMLIVAFNVPAIPVDTHVFRVSNRIGLTNAKNELECETQLMKLYDKKDWGKLHHLILLFGRYYCKAQNPSCVGCKLNKYCKYYKDNIENKKG